MAGGGPRYRIGARHTASRPYPGMKTAAVTGLPKGTLPGATGARTAALKRAQGVPTPAPPPQPEPKVRCMLDYLRDGLIDGIAQLFLNIQQVARRPAYIDPPLSGTCFDRHVGTGSAASGDAPVVVLPGGAPTLIADFTVPALEKGVIKYWGVDVAEGPAAAADLRWRFIVNGRRVVPFDPNFGAVAGGIDGEWAGPPFTLTDTGPLCILLSGEDVVQLQARYFGALPSVNVAARFGGWVFPPTTFETGRVVRAWMTDQQ